MKTDKICPGCGCTLINTVFVKPDEQVFRCFICGYASRKEDDFKQPGNKLKSFPTIIELSANCNVQLLHRNKTGLCKEPSEVSA